MAGAVTLKYTVFVTISQSVILLFYSTELHEFVQGNSHIRYNHEACCCLDSKPNPMLEYYYYSSRHQAAGIANSAIECNGSATGPCSTTVSLRRM